MTLSQLISERRRELGLTLEEVGNRIGVTRATVQRWESGNIKALKWTNAIQLAKALEIDPDELRNVAPERDDTLTDDERHLIDMYRRMSAPIRSVLLTNAEALAGQFGDEHNSITEVAK